MGFYYGLGYRLIGLGKWVCFPLLVVSTVGWGCFSFRLGLRGGFWFVAFRPAFSSPCSFTHRTGRGFLCRAGSEGFRFGVPGWTVVGGFGLRGPRLVESPLYQELWGLA